MPWKNAYAIMNNESPKRRLGQKVQYIWPKVNNKHLASALEKAILSMAATTNSTTERRALYREDTAAPQSNYIIFFPASY